MAIISINGLIVGVINLKQYSVKRLESNGIRIEKIL